MFTGIIEATARVLERGEASLTLKRPGVFTKLARGQSIAVNGACLSVTEFDADTMRFDVMPETFLRTNFASAERVNLERAMPANGRFEGHVVLGHVDGLLELIQKEEQGNDVRFRFRLLPELKPFVTPKGSITLNGVSLTISALTEELLEVALIPLTLAETTFADLQVGDQVHYEADYFAKLLRQWQ